MASIMAKYREAVELNHGWDIELACAECGWSGVPKYEGWTPGFPKGFGKTPTIYANLKCPECGKDLKDEAAAKLVELFGDIPIDQRNKGYLMLFITAVVGIPAVLLAFIAMGVKTGLWGTQAYTLLTLLPILIAPAIMLMNYKIGRISTQCECGGAKYIFLGMLGRSYCHHCSSCGKLLRTRD